MEQQDVSTLYEEAMYHRLIGKGYSEFQAKVLMSKITQRSSSPFTLKPEKNIEEPEQIDVSVSGGKERKVSDIIMIQADDKTIDTIMKRKKRRLKKKNTFV